MAKDKSFICIYECRMGESEIWWHHLAEGESVEAVAKELEIDIVFIDKLLNKFFKKFTSQIEEMYEAIEHKDFNKLYTVLHAVKGTSGNLRLTNIEELINTLETYTQKKDINFQWSKHFKLLDKYAQDYQNQLK